MINIAIVDDETDVFELFKIKFKKYTRSEEIKFHFFENGKLCYDFIHSGEGPKIFIVFTDINMPVMDGLTLLDHLKRDHNDIDVYLVSAYDYDEYKERAEAGGSDGFIGKPHNFKEIEDFIQQSISRHGIEDN
ncbi:MAG: response regulator [Bacteriovoracaceae bacterium]|nr:response regulator [Bacteriovoracaceae bacterium]